MRNDVTRDGRGVWIWLSDEELDIIRLALLDAHTTECTLAPNGHDKQVRAVEDLMARMLAAGMVGAEL
jgi:hypothetical protein